MYLHKCGEKNERLDAAARRRQMHGRRRCLIYESGVPKNLIILLITGRPERFLLNVTVGIYRV